LEFRGRLEEGLRGGLRLELSPKTAELKFLGKFHEIFVNVSNTKCSHFTAYL